MHLAGQATRQRSGERGYAMAALLVGLSIMAIMFTVVMPVWKQASRREKETELIFRGTQYAHAIGLFQRKFANAYPPNIDALVEQRFLRKKFKDPITNDDFAPILAGQGVPASGQQPGGQRGGTGSTTGGGRATQPGLSTQSPSVVGRPAGPQLSAAGQTAGGIQGVTSKSKDQSIRLYNGRDHYNEWAFVYVQQQQAPGAVGAGQGAPGPGGQRGQQPGPPGSGVTQPGGRGGRGPFGPNGPGGPGGRGDGRFGGGGATPIQPPSTPRGRF